MKHKHHADLTSSDLSGPRFRVELDKLGMTVGNMATLTGHPPARVKKWFELSPPVYIGVIIEQLHDIRELKARSELLRRLILKKEIDIPDIAMRLSIPVSVVEESCDALVVEGILE